MVYEDLCTRYKEFNKWDTFPIKAVTPSVTSPHFGGIQNADLLIFSNSLSLSKMHVYQF